MLVSKCELPLKKFLKKDKLNLKISSYIKKIAVTFVTDQIKHRLI
jgi:hypothetical protein